MGWRRGRRHKSVGRADFCQGYIEYCFKGINNLSCIVNKSGRTDLAKKR